MKITDIVAANNIRKLIALVIISGISQNEISQFLKSLQFHKIPQSTAKLVFDIINKIKVNIIFIYFFISIFLRS